MNGGSHIRAIGPGGAKDEAGKVSSETETSSTETRDPLSLDESWVEGSEAEDAEWTEADWDEVENGASPRAAWRDRVSPVLAFTTVVAWTAFYGWAYRFEIAAGGNPQQWIALVINWTIPVLLVAVAWLLAMRNSRREALRFGETANLLSREATALEERLLVVNRELSLAREFLGTQSRELESLGRVASERLSTHADRLQELVKSNGDQVDAIATVSTAALANMEKLRGDLPVISNSAKDVSSQIGQAGNLAHEQLDGLISGFGRLNEFGQASERQVESLLARVDAALASFEANVAHFDEVSASRFDALKERSEEFRSDLDSREVDALASMHKRADAVKAGLAELQEVFTKEEEKSATALKARIASLRGEGEAVAASLRKAEAHALSTMRSAKDQLHADITGVIERIDALDRKAMDGARERVAALRDEAERFDERLANRDAAFNEEITKRQDKFDTREAQATEVLGQRLAALDDELASRIEKQREEAARLVEHGDLISAKVEELTSLLAVVADHAGDSSARVDASLTELSERLEENRKTLAETGHSLAQLTDSSVRLLEIIQSGARQSREDLPQAIEIAQGHLTDVERRTADIENSLGNAAQRGEDLSRYVISTKEETEQVGAGIERIYETVLQRSETGRKELAELDDRLRQVGSSSAALAEATQSELRQSIAQLEDAATKALAALKDETGNGVRELAERIGDEASKAVDRALQSGSAEALGKLEQAAARASGLGREAATQLRDQLALVSELAGNLEQRVARARELSEEQVDNDFARRVALITESLNSNAIDISKALSSDVTDTAWASYLKGDRGIFTRRAVRLIDGGEAREIVDLFENDDDFREHVSRYIHDFEAMLRTMLSTRDGNALGVTVLSSDMGKLYVALAQAIDRLRG